MVLVEKFTYFAFKSRVQLNAFDAVPRRRVLEVASHRACRLTHGSGVAVVITGERRRHCRPGFRRNGQGYSDPDALASARP